MFYKPLILSILVLLLESRMRKLLILQLEFGKPLMIKPSNLHP